MAKEKEKEKEKEKKKKVKKEMKQDLLNCIFSFPHRSPCTTQSDSRVWSILTLFQSYSKSKFFTTYGVDDKQWIAFDGKELKDRIDLWPAFGAYVRRTDDLNDNCHYEIVFADCYQSHLNPSSDKSYNTSHKPNMMYIGQCPNDCSELVLPGVKEVLNVVFNKKKKKGYSPNFLKSMYEICLSSLEKNGKVECQQGVSINSSGFSTAEIHQKCMCWSLAKSIIHEWLNNQEKIEEYNTIICGFYCYLLNDTLKYSPEKGKHWKECKDQVNDLFFMAQKSTELLVQLKVPQTTICKLESLVRSLTVKIKGKIESDNAKESSRYILPDSIHFPENPIIAKQILSHLNRVDDLEPKKRVNERLLRGTVEQSPLNCGTYDSPTTFLDCMTAFHLGAAFFFDLPSDFSCIVLDNLDMVESCKLISSLYNSFKNLYQKIAESSEITSLLPSESDSTFEQTLSLSLRSTAILVKWIFLCLLHKQNRRKYGQIMDSFSLPLDLTVLDELFLPDKSAQNALVKCKIYLENQSNKCEMFHVGNTSYLDEKQFNFALQIARTDTDLTKQYNEYRKNEKKLMESTYQVVKENILQYNGLKRELEDLSRYWRNYDYSRKVTLESNLKSRMSGLEYVKVHKASLPSKEDHAMIWTFFKHMPPSLALLMEMSVLAMDEEHGPLKAFYSWSGSIGKSTPFELVQMARISFSKERVCILNTNLASCIGYPESGTCCILYNGSDDGEVHSKKNAFVEKMMYGLKPARNNVLFKFAMHDDDTRCNKAVAMQSEISSVGSSSWIRAGSVNCYSVRVFKAIINLLQDAGCNGMSNECLQKTILHGMLKVGTIAPRQSCRNDNDIIVSKRDLGTTSDDNKRFWKELSNSLSYHIGILENKSSELQTFHFLSFVVSFLYQFNEECMRYWLEKMKEFLVAWTEEEARKQIGDDSVDIHELKLKEAIYAGLLICCYSCIPPSTLTKQDAITILSANYVLHSGKLYLARLKEQRKMEKERKFYLSLLIYSAEIIAKNSTVLLQRLSRSSSKEESSISVIIRSSLASLPYNLLWKADGSCFTSVSLQGDFFEAELFTAKLLVNGSPPNFLATSIVEHPDYIRVFGHNSNHQCTQSDGTFSTVSVFEYRPTSDTDKVYRFQYEFRLHDGVLSIFEIELNGKNETLHRLEYIPHHVLEKSRLHEILREKYAVWMVDQLKIFVFRDTLFSKRKVRYICDEKCIHVISNEDQVLPWYIIRSKPRSYDSLSRVSQEDILIGVLKKFENPRYIHVLYITSDRDNTELQTKRKRKRQIVLDFSRYDLKFYLENNHKLVSEKYQGFHLDKKQQLKNVLNGITQYLVLVNPKENRTKVLLPIGEVDDSKISMSTDSLAKLHYFDYDLHERGNCLVSSLPEANLYLALVYIRSTTIVPDPELCMTGTEMAMDLIRRQMSQECSRRNQVETEKRDFREEQSQRQTNQEGSKKRMYCTLDSLLQIGKYGATEPGLILLCEKQLRLHSTLMDSSYPVDDEWKNRVKNAISYYEELTGSFCSPRRCLPQEDEEFLGIWRRRRRCKQVERIASWNVNNFDEKKLPYLEFQENFVYLEIEIRLEDSIVESDDSDESDGEGASTRQLSSLKLSLDMQSEKIQTTMCDDVIRSIEHHEKKNVESFHKESLKKLVNESLFRNQCRQQALINFIRALATPSEPSLQLLQLTNMLMIPRDVEFTGIILEKVHYPIALYNPNLSEKYEEDLKKKVIEWMYLCIQEDKLRRIQVYLDGDNNEFKILRELKCKRNWDVEEYPIWLVLEFLSGKQIWPRQADFTKKILSNPNSRKLYQLLMGEGKTSMIIPMLLLHHYQSGGFHFNSQLPTVIVPSPLFHSNLSLFRNSLTASILPGIFGIIATMEYERSFGCNLQLRELNQLEKLLKFLLRSGGCLLQCPEHHNSMQLSCIQWEKEEVKEKEREVLKRILSMPRFLLLDECDQILHCNNHLIYTMGTPIALPDLDTRMMVLSAILQALAKPLDSLYELLQSLVAEGSTAFPFRLKKPLGIKNSTRLMQEILKQVYDTAQDPSSDLRYIRDYSFEELQTYVCDPEVDANQCGMCQKEILSLRCFLRYDVLFTALQKQLNVQYGIPVGQPYRKKAVAVPFHSCGEPTPKSEFQDADLTIALTCLAYSKSGISQDALKNSLMNLRGKGNEARKSHFQSWLSWIEAEIPEQLNDFDKIDVFNDQQLASLHKLLLYSFPCIYYWLRFIVFPKDMVQYPQRIEHNPNHLVSPDPEFNGRTHMIGFSGTNDARHIFPEYVQQLDIDISKGTIAKLTYSLLHPSNTHRKLGVSEPEMVRKQLMDVIFSENATVLIEAGAYLSQSSPRKMAEDLIDQGALDKLSIKAVIFHDCKKDWWVMDAKKSVTLKNCCPYKEMECFVIIDEARCRGTDFQLSPNARAVLTLRTHMEKDPLMQACLRMRQFGVGQSICFISTQEVTEQITRSPKYFFDNSNTHLTIQQNSCFSIFQWSFNNSVKNIQSYLPINILQNLKANRPTQVEEEIYQLENYGHPLHMNLTQRDRLNRERELQVPKVDVLQGLTSYEEEVEKKIHWTSVSSTFTSTSKGEDECERELENETVLEKEAEYQAEQAKPSAYTAWNYVTGQPLAVRLYPLEQVMMNLKDSKLVWNTEVISKILVTENFRNTIQSQYGTSNCESVAFLHHVDEVMILPDGYFVLMNEYDSNVVKTAEYKNPPSENQNRLVHFYELKDSDVGGILHLMGGNADFNKDTPSWNAVRDLLKVNIEIMDYKDVQIELKNYLMMRGKQQHWEKSGLESILFEAYKMHHQKVEEKRDLSPTESSNLV